MVVSNHLPSRDVSDPSALRAAFDALPLSIVVLDATGVIVVANRAWREFGQRNGLRLEDSGVGTSYLQVCDTARGEGADDARAVGAAIRDALAASTVEHVLEYTCHSPVEQRWYLVRIQGTDVDGERRATVVHRDVTDRRKIEKARQMAARRELEALVDARTRELRVANEELHQAQASLSESEARFRAAANSTVDLIVEVDLRSDQLRWFGDVDGLLGYAPGEFPRTNSGFLQAHHPDDVERVRAEESQAFDAGETFSYECRVTCKDGSHRYWESRGRVIATADGKPTVAIGAHRDITERKQAEALLRASEQSLSRSQVRLRELASRLFRAHEDERRRLAREFHDDFSQRMAATSIQLGSLDKRFPDLPAEVRRELALVQEQVVELSDDLRRVSHELHPAALEQLGLESALRAHCARLTEHDPLELTFASEAVHAELDRDVSVCLFRVAQEPLRNVLRHSQARHAHVSLAGGDDGVELLVVDDGRGFDFEAARQRGSVGLVSMEERIRPLGGRLSVASAEGRGTEVRVFIPVTASMHDTA